MAADLYIHSLYQQGAEHRQRNCEKAARRRDRLTPGTDEHRQAQAKVEKCLEHPCQQGYFRDAYDDDHALLWKFGLSWWADVIPMRDRNGEISVAQAARLLAMLKSRHDIFELELAGLGPNERRYFLDRYTDLQKFLNDAIELNAPIDAWL
jgi:hypothetical protein